MSHTEKIVEDVAKEKQMKREAAAKAHAEAERAQAERQRSPLSRFFGKLFGKK